VPLTTQESIDMIAFFRWIHSYRSAGLSAMLRRELAESRRITPASITLGVER